MKILLVVVISTQILYSLGQECPAIYLRYSKEHSFCKPKNPSCQIVKSGMTDDMRKQVLDIHNKYRSQVAMGKEERGGGLSKAANMMQMVYDSELEAVIQKHLEQCNFDHDCNDCRQVENFRVGQNLYQSGGNSPPDWNRAITLFYDEVIYTNKKIINSFISASALGLPKKQSYGHFTQVIWADSWRIGCGYVAFKTATGYETLLGCNYGPSGNIKGNPVYIAGEECSACPINSCCGKSCKKPDYDGLCKMNKNEAPAYVDPKEYIFYCDFKSSGGDCSTTSNGKQWKLVNSLGGPFLEIILQGGESSTLIFNKSAKPKGQNNFCISLKYRSGPTVAGTQKSNTAEIVLDHGANQNKFPLSPNFEAFQITFFHVDDLKASVTFSVPEGTPPQFFNLALLRMYDGKCT